MEDRRAETQDANETELGKECGRRFVLRYYRVWNVEQCELPEKALDKLPRIETHEHNPIESVERIIARMPNQPAVEHAGTKAFYSSIADRIVMPPRNLFVSAEEYGSTVLHELTHSTGHKKRLARESITEAAEFGSAVYSKEEL